MLAGCVTGAWVVEGAMLIMVSDVLLLVEGILRWIWRLLKRSGNCEAELRFLGPNRPY
jgi:hypothetical protein